MKTKKPKGPPELDLLSPIRYSHQDISNYLIGFTQVTGDGHNTIIQVKEALANALSWIQDGQDGLKATTERDHVMNNRSADQVTADLKLWKRD